MENEKFHSDVDKMFESYLGQGEVPLIRVTQNGIINTKMPYDRVLFDSNLNIYKRMPDGSLEQITDTAFKAVVVSSR
jgi:hypothetical protein